MAILGGAASGGLEVVDFDDVNYYMPWSKIVEQKAPGLLDKLVLVRTPRPGIHAYYRCKEFGGNQKPAQIPVKDSATGKLKAKAVIELKGEGGLCVAPPSPRLCHPTQRCYTFVDGKDLTQIPIITPAERATLLNAARRFDTWGNYQPKQQHHTHHHSHVAAGVGRPGDDFNKQGDWAAILEPHDWHLVGDDGAGVSFWRRPGKNCGTSATTNYENSDLLYVFSSNAAPFDEETAYSKFHAYTLLEHDGDFSEAASALARQGYGETKTRTRRTGVGLRERYSSCRRVSRSKRP